MKTSPRRTMLNFSKLLIFLYPPLFIITFLMLLTEVFTYQGFISKHLFYNALLVPILSISLFSVYRYFAASRNSFISLLIPPLYVITSIVTLLYLFLQFQEQQHFSNYIFSTYHIHLSSLQTFTIFLILCTLQVLCIDPWAWSKTIQSVIAAVVRSPGRFLYVILIGFLLVTLVRQLMTIGSEFLNNTLDMMTTYDYSEKEKFVYKLGGNQELGWIMTFATFINTHTPENAKIFIPPQTSTWPLEGNEAYFRWFIYPREIIQATDENQQIPPEAEYVIVAYGTRGTQDANTWPRISINKQLIDTIREIDRKSLKESILIDTDYIPQINTEKWGLITLRKQNND